MPSGWPASGWPRPSRRDHTHRDRRLRDRDRRRGRDRVSRRARRDRGRPDRRRRRGARAGRAGGTDPRRIDGRGHLATPGLVNCHHHLYQWATRGTRAAGDAVRVARRALPGVGADRRRHVLGGGARRPGGARAVGLLGVDRSPLRVPARRRGPPRGRDRRRRVRRSALSPMPRLDGSRALGWRAPARRGRRGPRRDPGRQRGRDRPLPRPSRPARWCGSRWRPARRSR